jgi:hypothetical protein
MIPLYMTMLVELHWKTYMHVYLEAKACDFMSKKIYSYTNSLDHLICTFYKEHIHIIIYIFQILPCISVRH